MLNIYETDVWNYLADSKKPIVIYGMGNGAEKIISILKEYDTDINDIQNKTAMQANQILGGNV